MSSSNDATLETPLALPLWINGHAYLTMTERFFDVIDPRSGDILRRTPLCGADAAAKAVAAAQAVLPKWAIEQDEGRRELFLAMAEALEGYAAHFRDLITAESGKESDEAAAEVDEAIALLRNPWALTLMAGTVAAVVSDARDPLLGILFLAVPALFAGGVVVARPSPQTPSAIFAFAELSSRSGLPDGVFNILQGDEEAIHGLCAQADVGRIAFVGEPALGESVRAIAERHGKGFVSRD